MAINENSYGSTAEVAALSRVYLVGNSNFTAGTTPTLSEVETFIDRCSGVLNAALAVQGFTIPISQADAKRACDDWVVRKAAMFVHLSNSATFGGDVNPMVELLDGLAGEATAFAQMHALGFKRLNAAVSNPMAEGLVFTGETVQADRTDPDNSAIEQPKFTRGQFDA